MTPEEIEMQLRVQFPKLPDMAYRSLSEEALGSLKHGQFLARQLKLELEVTTYRRKVQNDPILQDEIDAAWDAI